MRLGTLLLRDAVVSLSQLEAALHSQVLYGGRLGTHLVALGFLDEESLSVYLSEALGVPVAPRAMFDAADPELVATFDPGLAERCEAFPLGAMDGQPDTLAVALANPRDSHRVAQLARALGRPIAPHVAPERRIYEYLERHFGVRRRLRQPEMPPGEAAGTPAPAREHRHEDEPRRVIEPPAPASPGRVHLPYADAVGALAHARVRDQVGDALIGFAMGWCEAAAVLAIRKGKAVPWRVHAASGRVPEPGAPGLPLGPLSVLQAAYDRGEPYRGRAPCVQQRIERALWRVLAVDREPREMLVVPVLVKQQVVNLVYAHGLRGEAIDDSMAARLVELAGHAARAYAQIIQRDRGLAGTAGA